jgi:hypothetical protein
MTARRLLAASVAGVAVLALAGCQRPAPIVTVVSGTSSTWKEADAYCFPGQSVQQGNCARRDSHVAKLEVVPGQRVGVDVSRPVQERGWLVELSSPGNQPQSSDVQKSHYFSFTAPNTGPQGLRLTVKAVDPKDPAGTQTGQWSFELVPKSP